MGVNPIEEGGAAKRPFSSASMARKARRLILFIMSSMTACDDVRDRQYSNWAASV